LTFIDAGGQRQSAVREWQFASDADDADAARRGGRHGHEQLSVRSGGDTNGSETLTTPTPLNQGTVKRLSGNFEDPPTLVQKSFVHIAAPELSEGALSRTVIISSLQLERNDNSVPGGGVPGVGPESPVPNLEPPC